MSIYAPSFFKLSDADYVPKNRLLSAVTNASSAVCTTTTDHGYAVGQLVRIHVDQAYGMRVDGEEATVLSVPTSDSFSCSLDTSSLSAFVVPTAPPAFTQAHVVPITGTEQNIA